MPVLFTVIGIVMLTAAIRDTIDGDKGLLSLLKSDFQGKNNFIYFIVAILLIGGIGYIPMMKTLSRYMLALVLVVIFLVNGGVWNKLIQALNGVHTSNTSQTKTNLPKVANPSTTLMA